MSVRALAINEARALLPLWVWSLVAATVAALTANNSLQAASLFGVLVATVGLVAQSLGHDYTDRTLNLSLTLPIARRSLFLVKVGVASAMGSSLFAYGWLMGLPSDIPPHAHAIAATGLCLAPWMTMV
jgi:ABC-type transport system involved in multi-copper enzyme maturation permease subunit